MPGVHPVQYGMREVGDAAVRDDPLGRPREVGVLLRERVELILVRRDAVTEDVAVARAGEEAVQLDAREDEDPVDRVASVIRQWSVIASTS